MTRLGTLGHRLHRGEVSYDFVGKRRIWFGLSIVITLVALVGLLVNGLNRGIEFSGGAVFTTPSTSVSASAAQDKAEAVITGEHDIVAQKLGTGGLRIQVSGISESQANGFTSALAKELHIPANTISPEVVGPSWGQEITQKAELGLVVFMVLVVLYLAVAFEWRMALAALVALIHDLTITIGVYAIVGFEVTPGTVIGLLTILGYSLYDTVVVFDGLKESTKGITGQTRYTFAELANRSLNQTLIRSINTTVVALLPVAALLFVGGGLLGAGTLNDIALALFVGLAAGAYSSIFIATPLVAAFTERIPEMRAHTRRVLAKRAKAEQQGGPDEGDQADEDASAAEADGGAEVPAQAAAGGGTAASGAAGRGGGSAQRRQPTGRNRGRGRPSGKRR